MDLNFSDMVDRIYSEIPVYDFYFEEWVYMLN